MGWPGKVLLRRQGTESSIYQHNRFIFYSHDDSDPYSNSGHVVIQGLFHLVVQLSPRSSVFFSAFSWRMWEEKECGGGHALLHLRRLATSTFIPVMRTSHTALPGCQLDKCCANQEGKNMHLHEH